MKIRLAKHRHGRGTVLAVTLVITGIVGLFMGSFLIIVESQHLSVARAQAWSSAIAVAEGGVEEAMAHLNSGVAINNLGVNSWTDIGGGNYRKTNVLGTSYSVVTINTTNTDPVITAVAYVPGPISSPVLTRTVQVNTKSKSALNVPGAMIVSTTVNFNGSGITTDSFNSTNSLYSTGGMYDPAKAQDHGDVWSTSTSTNAIQVDNGTIKGSVHTGAGGVVSVGSQGVVGDFAYVTNKSNLGTIEAGHQLYDGNLYFPDASLPTPPGGFWLPPVPGNYKINGVTYKYILNGSSGWILDNLDGGVYVNGPGVMLQVTGGFSLGSKDEIHITTSGDMTLYSSAANSNIGGNGIINDTGLANKFKYVGLPSNTALSFSANAAFVGQIYAPEADFTLGGGGHNTYDFVGQCITKSATMNGHYNFHYDEGAPAGAAATGFLATSWDEL